MENKQTVTEKEELFFYKSMALSEQLTKAHLELAEARAQYTICDNENKQLKEELLKLKQNDSNHAE
ncbi:hypothetical protein [Bacillus sp. LLTC93]|uniref:hypothetical protein n=1 Tax=Bacillus sp. LLTC93 TaxID=2108274 RepID=UPI000D012B30|nr:hypothetical protein [Bacillus sp. LLTC93]PRO41046.1 hypothetical protein C6W18_11975 [Bacillus sp. LLTC93]